MSSSNTNKKMKRMPGTARMGLTLLLIGAILVGVGTYANRGAVSLYGLILVIIGFSTYMISSIIAARRNRK
ncbi:MAG: SpoVA/SpoVAEb family sporulation membrane protein [Nitrososphaeraceae archaeon]